jgi:hypothetical protein
MMTRSIISLSTQVFDLQGFLTINNVDMSASDLDTLRRRAVRTDRTLTIAKETSADLYDALAYLIKNYSLLWVMLPDGAFVGTLSSLAQRGGQVIAQVLIQGDA